MFKVSLIAEGLTRQEEIKVGIAANRMQAVINHPSFKEFVLNFSFTKKKTKGYLWWRKTTYENCPYFVGAERMSRTEVYNQLMNGRERLSNDGVDHEADIYLKIDRSNSWGVIGYTRASTKWQWIYSRFFNKFDVNEIAGNLAHEWCHKLGFKHSRKRTATRKYSVPYIIGYFVRDFPN